MQLPLQPSPGFSARYRLDRPLGRGASGYVVRATQSGLGRAVAVKFLDLIDPGPDALARFEGEARGLAALSHPHVLRVFDYGTDGSHRYIVTELASASLGDLVNAQGPLDVPRAVAAALDVARGLEYLHGRGMVHRDLKPHNLFVMEDGRVVLGDFGLAVTESGRVARTTTGVIVGTPRYMAPELFEGMPFSPATDLYALGVTLFEVLTGRPPVPGERKGFWTPQCSRPATPLLNVLPEAPEPLARIVDRLLEREPLTRAFTAAELRVALERLLEGAPALASAVAAAPTLSAASAVTFAAGAHAQGSTALTARARPLGRAFGPAAMLAGGLCALGLALLAERTPPPPAPPSPTVFPPDPARAGEALRATLQALDLPARGDRLSKRWRAFISSPEGRGEPAQLAWLRTAVAALTGSLEAAGVRGRLAEFHATVAGRTALDHPLSAPDLPVYFALNELADLAAAVAGCGSNLAGAPALDPLFAEPLPAHWRARHEPALADVHAFTVATYWSTQGPRSIPGGLRSHQLERGWRRMLFGDLALDDPVEAIEHVEGPPEGIGKLVAFLSYDHPAIAVPQAARPGRLEVGLRCRPSSTAAFRIKLTGPEGPRAVAVLGRNVPRTSQREAVSYFLALDPALIAGKDARIGVEVYRMPHVPLNYGARLNWITVRWR